MAKLNLVKQVENAILYQDEKDQLYIRIDNVRGSYVFVGTPANDEGDDGETRQKWRIVLMLPKKTHLEAKNLIVEVINRLIKENVNVPKERWFIKNGDEHEDENMHGHWLVSASDGRYRPKARDAQGHVIDEIDEIDDTFYSGCWLHALIRPWFFDGKTKNSKKTFPKRISAGLNSVMFARDDKPFGSGRIDDSEVWGDDDGMGGGRGDDDMDDADDL